VPGLTCRAPHWFCAEFPALPIRIEINSCQRLPLALYGLFLQRIVAMPGAGAGLSLYAARQSA